jgi:hypothetical protein
VEVGEEVWRGGVVLEEEVRFTACIKSVRVSGQGVDEVGILDAERE